MSIKYLELRLLVSVEQVKAHKIIGHPMSKYIYTSFHLPNYQQ